MKCEVFRFEEFEGRGSVTPAIVEKGLNNWLAQHRPSRVVQVAQSESAVFIPESAGHEPDIVRALTVTLWYEE